jgi:iron complex transport system ATP-binding protein
MTSVTDPVVLLNDISVIRDQRALLQSVDWTIDPGQHWVVLGANGSGKTTLLRVVSTMLHPTTGSVRVLGETLGRTDVRTLRTRIGMASAALADQLRPQLLTTDVVMTAKNAALEPWWHIYDDADRTRARDLLISMGCAHLVDREFGIASSGERQRVLLARSLMTDPGLVLLDEPTAALDLGGREDLIATLDELASDPAQPPTVLVTHHVEEIPPAFTHCLMLREGEVIASGPIGVVLTESNLSRCFDRDLELANHGKRWSARIR